VLPEFLSHEELMDAMIDVVSHEFFHIISPLSVQSEDIHDFDYNMPTFSKHLWMYEGVTEYFASHFQVYEALESRTDFYEKMAGKMESAAGYDDAMSFTMMSENIIDPPYAENYANVYEKGALIGMCMDVILRDQSDGARSMLSLMKELSARYGRTRPFEDDALIDEIAAMTYPAVGAFLRTHVVGDVPIDYATCLDPVGLRAVGREVPVTLFFLDQQIPFIDANPATGEVFFRSIKLNTTLEAMGVHPGDVIESVNGGPFTLANAGTVIQASFQWTPQTPIEIAVRRGDERLVLTGLVGSPALVRQSIEEIGGANARQMRIREAWLGG
jgi:predicted metalloprotease with PDZ domain